MSEMAAQADIDVGASKQETTSIRYFIDSDCSGHQYYIPWDRREEWALYAEIPEDDERSWEVPYYAVRIDGGTLTFEKLGDKHMVESKTTKWWQKVIGYTVAFLLLWRKDVREAFWKGYKNG